MPAAASTHVGARVTAQQWGWQHAGQNSWAVSELDLDIEAGQRVLVLGPSGSGKSTLLNMVGLLDRPDSGSYRLEGTATEELGEEARARLRADYVGFIFQAFHLINRLTTLENVELPMMLAGIAPKKRRQSAPPVAQPVPHRPHDPCRPNCVVCAPGVAASTPTEPGYPV